MSYTTVMKKIVVAALLLIIVSLPFSVANASHFQCLLASPGSTTAVVKVRSASILTEFVKVLNVADPNTSYAVSASTFVYQDNDASYDYEDLEPSSTYRVLVFNGAGDVVEEIKSCTFETKVLSTTQNPNPAPNPNQQNPNPVPTGSDTYTPPKNPNALDQATGFSLQVRLNNPLKVNTIAEAVKFFVTTLIKIAIPVIVVFFIWAGFSFITARGKPDKIKDAKKMFWYTIIGTLLILGAWTITNAIIGTVNSITK